MNNKLNAINYTEILTGKYIENYNKVIFNINKEIRPSVLMQSLYINLGQMVVTSQYFEFVIDVFNNLRDMLNSNSDDNFKNLDENLEYVKNEIKNGISLDNNSSNFKKTIENAFEKEIINEKQRILIDKFRLNRNYYTHHHFVINPYLNTSGKELKNTIIDICGLIFSFSQEIETIHENLLSKYVKTHPNYINFFKNVEDLISEYDSKIESLLQNIEKKVDDDISESKEETELWGDKLIADYKKSRD